VRQSIGEGPADAAARWVAGPIALMSSNEIKLNHAAESEASKHKDRT